MGPGRCLIASPVLRIVETFRTTWGIHLRGQRGIRARRLARGRDVIAPEILLAVGFGKPLLEHPVIVPDNGRKFGMEIQESIYKSVSLIVAENSPI